MMSSGADGGAGVACSPPLRTLTGDSVTVADVAGRRELRARIQDRLCRTRPGTTIVAAKLNIPGPVKDGPLARAALGRLCEQLERDLRAAGGEARPVAELSGPAGPEQFWAASAPAATVKGALIALEESAPGGRLLDADVWCSAEAGTAPRALSRSDLGLGPRTCFVCGLPARGCARSRRHPLPVLVDAVVRMLLDATGRCG
ncbi:MAG: citrate lyase holo-[acyl-carrier protein] synthase [Microbacteriaceae bacterium]|nr:citrate lyase holo-[acyl-carrier protein] synthase [Microbacteriaceae bacterium]MCI1207087.1 citrate lyase holo-[acyl-carrier protein] synthase [Microbacteriaceae bacterium]